MVQPAAVSLVEQSPQVLIVGMEGALRECLSNALEWDGYVVRSVVESRAASAQLQGAAFDVIVVALPPDDPNGPAFVAQVARLQPDAFTLTLGGAHAAIPATRQTPLQRRQLKPSQLEAIVRLVAQSLNRRLTSNGLATQEHARLRTSFNRVLADLWLAYQPIVHADSGEVFGFEALLRCGQAPTNAPTPHLILKTAEQLDLLRPLGRAIRRLAAKESSLQGPDMSLFVNLHPTDLRDPLLFSAAAALSRIAPRVVLEITERSSLHEFDDVAERIRRLRRLGFRIALDDLGAGHSGLGVMAKIEPEVVKLDMSLIKDIHKSSTQQKVVRSMIGLSRDLGALIVAEGVECEADRATLQELGCDLLQGYLFGEPARSRTSRETSAVRPIDD